MSKYELYKSIDNFLSKLTQDDFDYFWNLLSTDEDSREVNFRNLRRNIVSYLEKRCYQPETCASLAIDRFIFKLQKKRSRGDKVEMDIEMIEKSLKIIANLVCLEQWGKLKNSRLEDWSEQIYLLTGKNYEQKFQEDCEETCSQELLDKKIKELPPERQVLLRDYYSPESGKEIEEHRKQLPEKYGITDDAMRHRIKRAKDQVKDALKSFRDSKDFQECKEKCMKDHFDEMIRGYRK